MQAALPEASSKSARFPRSELGSRALNRRTASFLFLPPRKPADFSFDKLGGFTFSENLQDFVTHDHIEALTHPQSLGDLYDAMEGVVAEYCKPDK